MVLDTKLVGRRPGTMHELTREVGAPSDFGTDVLRVEEGSLYPALYRMTRKGWIGGKWGTSENNRRAKYYHLTSEGRRQFVEQTSGWQRFASAVNQAVASTRAPSWAR